MMDTKALLEMKHGDSRWQAERRRCEQFLTGAERRFLMFVRAGDHEKADGAYTDMIQTMDELLQLAGVSQ